MFFSVGRRSIDRSEIATKNAGRALIKLEYFQLIYCVSKGKTSDQFSKHSPIRFLVPDCRIVVVFPAANDGIELSRRSSYRTENAIFCRKYPTRVCGADDATK